MKIARQVCWITLLMSLTFGVSSCGQAKASEIPNNLSTLVNDAYDLAIPVLVAMDNFYRSNGRLPHNGDEEWLDALDEVSHPRIGIGGIGTLMVSVTIDKVDFGFDLHDLDNLFIRFEPKKGNNQLTWFCTSNLQFKAKHRPALQGKCKHGIEYPSHMNMQSSSSLSTENTDSSSKVVNQGPPIRNNQSTSAPVSTVVGNESHATPKLLAAAEPVYPARALSRGIEGYVDVQFTIRPDGTTTSPIVVFSTSSLFERSATKAVLGSRYEQSGRTFANVRERVEFAIP